MLVNHKTKLLLLLCLLLASLGVKVDWQSQEVKVAATPRPGYIYYKDTTPFAKEKANKSGYYPSAFAQEISRKAIDAGVDPLLALGTAMKESNWGTALDDRMEANPFMSHVVHADTVNRRLRERSDIAKARESQARLQMRKDDPYNISHYKYEDFPTAIKDLFSGKMMKDISPPSEDEMKLARENTYKVVGKALRDELINNGLYQIRRNLAKSRSLDEGIKRYNWNAKTDVKYTKAYMEDFKKNPEIMEIVRREKLATPRWEGPY